MEKIKQVAELVSRFQRDYEYFKSDRYNETLLRSDFLDPLFELLGWDIKNTKGKSTSEREVLLEEPLKADALSNTKNLIILLDCFQIGNFFLKQRNLMSKLKLRIHLLSKFVDMAILLV